MTYDVFDISGGEPAFEIVSDEEMQEMQSGRLGPTVDDTDDTAGQEVEIAHGVSAATAAELVGLPPSWIERLERHIAEYGSLAVGNFHEDFLVKGTCDD